MSNIEDRLLEVVKTETIPAIGCTEPIAVALAAAEAGKHIDGDLESLVINTSKGIFKNGRFVKIPNTDLYGLDLAGITGFLYGDPDRELLVLEHIDENNYIEAKELLNNGLVKVDYLDDAPAVYVEVIASDGDDQVKVILKDSHNHIEQVIKNGRTIYKDVISRENSSDNFIKDLSFSDILNIIETIAIEKLDFIQDGINMNLNAANKGLEEDLGLGLGKTLQELTEEGLLGIDSPTHARILTTAAADVRMGGDVCPIMTSAGSGNQGLSAVLPVVVVAEEHNIDDDRLSRAVFFAHIINKYVKLYTGKLSFLCGCAIAAGMGASSAISWMLGGSEEQIAGAANNMLSNLAGMICDGAKESCAFKLGTSSAEAVISAYLANRDVLTGKGIGIIGDTIEESIENIGTLSKVGYPHMDTAIIGFME